MGKKNHRLFPAAVSGVMLFLFLLSVVNVAFGIQHVDTTRKLCDNPLEVLPTSSSVSNPMPFSSSTAPPINYDEQVAITLTQNFADLAYNVTAVAQNDTYGYGPSYLLNGLSNSGYWYQVGLSYDWPHQDGGYNPSFNMLFQVYSAEGSVFPIQGGSGSDSYSGPVNNGDTVLLHLYFSDSNVIMYSYDWNTGANASEKYTAGKATLFMGDKTARANEFGFFTGLMTEEYYTSPYYGNEQFVTYSNSNVSVSSAWMWIDEIASNKNLFYQCSSSPVVFDNSHQLHEFSTNGATEYADAYDFYTGENPLSININAQEIQGDAGVKTVAKFSVTPEGGTAPYTYNVFLDNNLIATLGSNSSNYNVSVNFGLQKIGSHFFYVDVADLNGYQMSSESVNFTINPNPEVTIFLSTNVTSNGIISSFANFFISNSAAQANASAFGGASPYTYVWYLNGVQVEQTRTSSYVYRFSAVGQNHLQVNVTDAAGFTAGSQIMTVQSSYILFHIVVVAIIVTAIIAVILSIFFLRAKAHPTGQI